jgi:hypothetical protein
VGVDAALDTSLHSATGELSVQPVDAANRLIEHQWTRTRDDVHPAAATQCDRGVGNGPSCHPPVQPNAGDPAVDGCLDDASGLFRRDHDQDSVQRIRYVDETGETFLPFKGAAVGPAVHRVDDAPVSPQPPVHDVRELLGVAGHADDGDVPMSEKRLNGGPAVRQVCGRHVHGHGRSSVAVNTRARPGYCPEPLVITSLADNVPTPVAVPLYPGL